MVDGGLQVDDFQIAPVGGDGGLILLAATGTAAVIDVHDHVAIGGEKLPLEIERVRVLPVGAAVDAKQGRVLFALHVGRRLGVQTVDLGPVLGFAGELFGGAEV